MPCIDVDEDTFEKFKKLADEIWSPYRDSVETFIK